MTWESPLDAYEQGKEDWPTAKQYEEQAANAIACTVAKLSPVEVSISGLG